jgi:hypothetical protein
MRSSAPGSLEQYARLLAAPLPPAGRPPGYPHRTSARWSLLFSGIADYTILAHFIAADHGARSRAAARTCWR